MIGVPGYIPIAARDRVSVDENRTRIQIHDPVFGDSGRA